MSLFDQLKLLYEHGLYSNAAALGCMVLTLSENSSEMLTYQQKYQTLVYFGDSLFHLKDFKRAEVAYKKALVFRKSLAKNKGKVHQFPQGEVTSDVDVKYQAHLCLMQFKQYQQAINMLESIPGKQRTPRVNMALGKLYQLNSMERPAIACYKEVVKECHFAIEAAQRLLLLGVKPAEVGSLMMNGSSNVPNIEWLPTWIKAHSHLHNMEHNQSITLLRQIDTKTTLKDNIDILSVLGEAYYISGDNCNALAVFDRIRCLDPLLLKGMDMYSALLAKEKKVKELENLSSQLISISDSSPEAWLAMAHFCFVTKKGTRAINFAYKACSLCPRYVEGLLLRGNILFELKRLSDAIALFGEAYKLAPYRYEAHKGLVDCYLALHRRREAIGFASSACKQLGQSARSLTLYASVLVKDPVSSDKAKTLLEKALKQDPTYLNAVYLLASIYEQERMYEKGIELLKKQMEQQTTCRLHQMLGDFLARTNEHEKALHHFSIALNMDPSNSKAAESTQRVEQNPESSESFEIDVDVNDSENEGGQGELEESEVEALWSDGEYS